ncbi:unnamed protein product [Rotaria magnacalcarata]
MWLESKSVSHIFRKKMQSKDVQKVVKSKYGNGDGPVKIYRDLAGVVSLKTIKLWIKMIDNTGSINLSSPPDRPRIVQGIYNAQNDRVWAMSREEADKKGAMHKKQSFRLKSWSGWVLALILNRSGLDSSYSYDVIMILVEAIKQVDHSFLEISAQTDRSKWQVDSEGDT